MTSDMGFCVREDNPSCITPRLIPFRLDVGQRRSLPRQTTAGRNLFTGRLGAGVEGGERGILLIVTSSPNI